ncbi:hypothetical protein C7N43_09740 [Sphingobacteriales bacterium UPWRP_1]|nr:hypothetical protein B6N25_11845 [Sphingobacteriales bacterium TSM_CSS]PSJ77215.1 hypothetical protein C7N43_09740 [Sphingobacteriales bacterium UPWRP_1]
MLYRNVIALYYQSMPHISGYCTNNHNRLQFQYPLSYLTATRHKQKILLPKNAIASGGAIFCLY